MFKRSRSRRRSKRKSGFGRRVRGGRLKNVLLAAVVAVGLSWGTYVLVFSDSSSGDVSAQADRGSEEASLSETDVERLPGSEYIEEARVIVLDLKSGLKDARGVERNDVWMKSYKRLARFLVDESVPQVVRREVLPFFNRSTDEVFFSNRRNEFSGVYVIQSGDSLDGISKRYNVTPELLMRWNDIPREKAHLIRTGDSLKIVKGEPRVVVDKSAFTLNYFFGDKLARQYVIAHGKGNNTPLGVAQVTDKILHPDRQPGAGENQLEMRERWIGLSSFEEPNGVVRTGIGIHGTRHQDSIGEESSKGCVRMYNDQVVELYDWVPHGMTVEIKA